MRANFFVKPVADQYYMTDVELAAVRKQAHDGSADLTATTGGANANVSNSSFTLVLVWTLVLMPISYEIWSAVQKAWALFN